MDLKQRLTNLRRQNGTAPPAAQAPRTGKAPVQQRLHRLQGQGHAAATQQTRDEQVAELLEGTCVAEGLIVVERQFPLSHQHGKQTLAALTALPPASPPTEHHVHAEELIFMDTETTGLSGGTGTLAFLLGLGRIEGEVLRLRQFFLTAFRGEMALLRAVQDWIEGREHLVTFNGKSFDAPLMATRYRLAGLQSPFTEMQHIDLFHPTRRAFNTQWPDCRLQTAEKRLLGFHRVDDLPSHLVPDAWFAFVRRGATRRLPAILAHNSWDLMSLVVLLPSLAQAFATPGMAGADVTAVARYWLRRGDEAAALAHLQAHQEELETNGVLELARLYRRQRQWEAAVSLWQRLAETDCLEAIECLAKYHEHQRRDYDAALRLTRRLTRLERQNDAHQKREYRLLTKCPTAHPDSERGHLLDPPVS